MQIQYTSLEYADVVLDTEGYAVPFEQVSKLLEAMVYASGYRIAVLLLCLTGMRVSELNQLQTCNFYGNFIVWKPGKGQKGYRKEKLPAWFLLELDDYIKTHDFVGRKLFSFNANSLNRYVNMRVRPKVGGMWLKKRPRPRGNIKTFEYVYQLKGLRHNFQTLDFANNLDKWGKDVAIEFTSKRMKHSSYKMTARHYIQNFESLEIERYKGESVADIIKERKQTRLTEFIV